MKKLSLLIIALIASFVIFSCARGTTSKVYEEEQISKLIETASTPEDHVKIAEYYEKQADEAERKAHFHASMAESYRNRGKPLTGLANHCSNLANKYEEAAEEYEAMAMEHRQMAKET